MKSTLRFQVLSGDYRRSGPFDFTCWLKAWESGSEGGVWFRGNHGHTAGIPRHKGLHCWGHTCHVELNSSPVHLHQKAKAALTPRASCLLLFPFWSLSKGTFLVRWRLCNLWIVTQFSIKFMSTAASHKITGLVTVPAILSEKEPLRSDIDWA